ncbi:MAG TPA: alpha/beta hydrolase [Casimicrobiaceae bacterium]|nr:alpha/beta hydrolase [Casimicrobiaceae bacterium]
MPIDPDLAKYLADVAAEIPPLSMPAPPDARRARMEAVARRFAFPEDEVERRDHWLHLAGRELLVRIYRPGPGRLPAIVYLHGGGWVAGSVASHDGACATLASDANAVVASVQYRRAPENPFPAPNDDAFAALQWLARSARDLCVDESSIGIAGDSAGAHLALGAAIEARDRGGPGLAMQLLIYPVVAPDFETASYLEHAVSPTLSRADMIEYWNHYLPGRASDGDRRALPFRDALRGLPPALVVVAGLDPLHDEGVALARRLEEAQGSVRLADEPTLAHGFMRAAPFCGRARSATRAFGQAAGEALRRAGKR